MIGILHSFFIVNFFNLNFTEADFWILHSFDKIQTVKQQHIYLNLKKLKENVKMKMRKFLVMLTAATMAMGTLAGCGGSDTGSDSAAQAEETQEAAAENTDETTAEGPITVVSREDGSGTRGAFIELFGVQEEQNGEKVDMTTTEASITNSTSVMLTSVAGDPYAIGYVSLGSLDDTVKAVKIDGVEATGENVSNGSYKIARPFNIVTKDGLSDVAQDFIDYIMSADGQAIIEENNYIKASDEGAYEGTKPEGKVVVAGSSSVTPVMEKLKEAYIGVNPNAEIEIQQSDSTTGVTSTIDGICDIGMASRELKDSETSEGVASSVIAMDGIAVIVNQENPLDELSSEQVKDIYTGAILDWAELAQ